MVRTPHTPPHTGLPAKRGADFTVERFTERVRGLTPVYCVQCRDTILNRTPGPRLHYG